MKDMAANIGKTAWLEVGESGQYMHIEVTITDCRKVYGRSDYQVEPKKVPAFVQQVKPIWVSALRVSFQD